MGAVAVRERSGGKAGPADTGTKPVDLVYLRRFTFGNTDLEREVLGLFSEQAPIYLSQLRTARSVKAWADAAHTIKGSARAVGAWQVARAAEAAERLGHSAEPGRRVQAIETVAAAMDEARRFVADLYPESA
jgi:HPt (histidine-containing phosphotransfer) domain-containing protein